MKNAIDETVSHSKKWNGKKYSYDGRVPAVPAPTGLTRTIAGNVAVLQWTPSTALGLVRIQKSTGGVVFEDVATVAGTTSTYMDSNISTGNTYYWRVVAEVGTDTSAPSNVASYSLTSFNISQVVIDTNTNRLRIEGSGFGSMDGDVVSYMRGDEFTSGAINGKAASVGPAISTFVIGMGADTAGAHLYFDTASARTGRAAAMVRRHFDTNNVYRAGGFGPSNIHKNKLFFSFYRKTQFPDGWVTPENYNYKSYYVFCNGTTVEGGSDLPQPILHIPGGNSTFRIGANLSGSDPNIPNTAGWDVPGSMDVWQRWDSWFVLNSAPGVQNGIAKVWRDGILGINDETFSWFGTNLNYAQIPTHFEDVRLGYMDQGMSGFVAAHDSVYVADTMVRVELGNASTWSACTKFQIQVATAANWTATSIDDVLYDLGEIPANSAYIYLIGANGQPLSQNGYKLQQQAALIFSQDFSANTNGIANSHTGQNRFVRVSNNAPTGKTHSIRFNLKNGVTDPHTLQPGSNLYTADFKPVLAVPTFDPAQHDSMTWIMWFRYDDALWGGQSDPLAVNGALVHIGDVDADTAEKGFSLSASNMGGSSGRLNIVNNWTDSTSPWFNWKDRSYGWRNSSNAAIDSLPGTTEQAWGADGKWHELRIQFDFLNGNAGHTRARVLIDRFPVKAANANFDADGWFKLPPKSEFVPAVMRLGFADATSVNASTNRTGIAAGMQWGNTMEVWNGLVDSNEAISSQPTLVPLPGTQFWLGDSQITGAAPGTTCKSNRTAFMALWPSYYTPALTNTTAANLGLGGRGIIVNSLNQANTGHLHALQSVWGTNNTPRTGPEWVHYVETGNQNLDGQRTASEYGANFEAMVRWIKQKSPNCIISTETPFSFGSIGVQWRDWTAYETEIRIRVNKLEQEGIKVHLVENRALVDALVAKLGASTVWYTDPLVNTYRHFTPVGNLLTAVGIYWTLGHDLNQLNFAPIIAEGLVTQAQIDAILEVVAGPKSEGVQGSTPVSGGTSVLAWSAPEGLVNGKTIVLSSNTPFVQPTKQIYLGFGMGWLYEQQDGTALPSTLNVNGQIFDQELSPQFSGRTVVTVNGRKVLRNIAKPAGASEPYGAGVLSWDTGGEITNSDVAYAFKSSRLSIGSLPSGDYQWKQLRMWSTTELEGDGANEAYIPFGPNGWGRVAASIGQSTDVGYNTSIPRGVVGEGLWSSFGWAWRPNTVDQSNGEMATHYKLQDTVGFLRRNPVNNNTYPVQVIQSSSTRRPRYIMTQDYIGNTGAGDADFAIDVTDLYFKVGGDLFILADHQDLSQCTENPVPLVPISFDSGNSWTFRLWKGEMTSLANKYIHRLDSLLNPVSVVSLVPSEPVASPGVSLSNDILTITGSGFPTKSRAAPVWWDNFTGATAGETLDQRTPLVDNANGTNTWSGTQRGTGVRPYAVLTGNRIPGKPSARHDFSTNNFNCSLDVRHNLPNARAPAYFSFWWKINPIQNIRQVKPFALYGTRDGTWPEFYVGMGNYEEFPLDTTLPPYDASWRTSFQDTGIQSTYANGGVTGGIGNFDNLLNRFIKIEICLIQGDPLTANGFYACRIYDPDNPAGPTTYDVARNGIVTRGSGDFVWRQFGFGHYAGTPSGYSMACTVFTDDIYLDDSEDHVRVVVGNNSDYALCTVVEDQPPLSWSGNQIQCTFNRGRFAPGETVHVFIVTGAGHSGYGNATHQGSFVVPSQKVITGTGFGAGPDVVLFDRFRGQVVGETVDQQADIGTWNVNPPPLATARPPIIQFDGRYGVTHNNPTNGSTRYGLNITGLPQHTKFLHFFKVGVPTGKHFPGGQAPETFNTTDSVLKMSWHAGLSDHPSAASNNPDLVSLTFTPSVTSVGNNIAGVSRGSSGFRTHWDWGKWNSIREIHIPDPSLVTGPNGKYNLTVHNSKGVYESLPASYAAFQSTDEPLTANYFDRLSFMSWSGNADMSNAQLNFTSAYLAIGDNADKHILLGNASSLAACTNPVDIIAPDVWTNTEIRFTPTAEERAANTHYFIMQDQVVLASGPL